MIVGLPDNLKFVQKNLAKKREKKTREKNHANKRRIVGLPDNHSIFSKSWTSTVSLQAINDLIKIPALSGYPTSTIFKPEYQFII